MKKIHVIGGAYHYTNWLQEIGYQVTQSIEEANVLMFTGGEDVTPSIYEHKRLQGTGNNPVRDKHEVAFFEYAIENDLPMI
jgi:gamma-glutamyl-gamma-aminobutyrate hydrolase PuuD